MRVIFWDIETSIKTSYKRKANPFDKANYIVASGWKVRYAKEVAFEYFGRNGPTKGWFTKLLDSCDLLVGANIKFDILHAIQDPENYKAWMKWIVRGGQIWDIQLAQYLIKGMIQSSHMASLDDMAPEYGGNVKFDEVKALWEAGVETADIPVDLLRKYLSGAPGHAGDVENTEVVFNGQLELARITGQVNSIMLNMGSLVCTIEMEHNGMAVDGELGAKLALELEEKLRVAEAELQKYLPADMPFQFNWGSGQQKSALLFGGSIPYKIQEPMWKSGKIGGTDDGSGPLYTMMEVECYYGHDGNFYPVEDVMADGGPTKWNLIVNKSGKNAGEYKTKKCKLDDISKGQKLRWVDYTYQMQGFTKPDPEWATKTPGVYSTSGDVIEALGNRDIPFLKLLASVASMNKDLGTYFITDDPKNPGQKKGMLTLIQPDGIIHHGLNHTSTVTGRFSSSNPNLQNLPKGDKSQVKKLFKSRFLNGSVIQSDFSSLEVYVQAILTKSANLIADLKQGLDMHCVRVSQKEGVSYEEAVRLCKGYMDGDNFIEPVKEWVYKRTGAKEFSFQRAYGAGVAAIAKSTGIPEEDVQALADAEDIRYPEISPFYTNMTAEVKGNAKFTGTVIKHPKMAGLDCFIKRGTYVTPDGKVYAFTNQPAPEWMLRSGQATSFSPTEIKNYPVQGTGGEWAKAAMWLAVRAFYYYENFGGEGLLVNQVHDAVYADSTEAARVKVAAVLHACMEQASTFMEWFFNWEQPLPVPSDTSYGPSMYEDISFGNVVEFKPLVKEATAFIRERYMNNYVPSYERKAA